PILSDKASTLTYYQKGAWALHVIRESIGAEKFRQAVKTYLEKHAFGNVTTEDLFAEIKAVSDFDTETFSKNWLETPVFQKDEVTKLLRKNEFISTYMDLNEKPLHPEKDKKKILKLLKSKAYYPIKELLIYQTASLPFEKKKDILEAGLKTGNIKVRQAVATTLQTIPESFRTQYETLLNDDSYYTKEIALFNLWTNFESHRDRYIALSENWVGIDGRNLEILHHSLSFVTADDPEQQVADYYALLKLSGTNYDAVTRQNALEKLLSFELYTKDVFK